MKALQLVPAMERGGVERVVCDVNRALVGRGWTNVVVSAGGRLVAEIGGAGGRHVALDLRSKNPLTFFQRAARLRRLLLSERPDVVCAHSRVPAWICRWAMRGLDVRWLTYAHGANSVSKYSEVMAKGDLVLVPSRFVADYLKANYGLDEAKIRVVPPAVSDVRFDPAALDRAFVGERRRAWRLADGVFTVMAVGRITPVKGLDLLLRAFARLDGEGWRLVIVGGPDAGHAERETALRSLAAELGVADRVVFAGDQDKVPECLSLADVVVSANTVKPESFGLSMAEALMMDRPVVAKAFGGALDIVRDGTDGVLVHGDGAEDFAAALARVRTMTFAGLRTSARERFSTAAMTGRLLAAYEQVRGR